MAGPSKSSRKEIINIENIENEVFCDSDSEEEDDIFGSSDGELPPIRDQRFSDSEDSDSDTNADRDFTIQRRPNFTTPPFTGPPHGFDKNTAPSITKDFTPFEFFQLFFKY